MRHHRLVVAMLVALESASVYSVTSAQTVDRVNAEGLGRLAAFSHATVAGDLVFVSGTLGTQGDGFALAEGIAAQTTQALANIERILGASGSTSRHVAKVNVYLTNMELFTEMNKAYIAHFGEQPPARTTVGVSELALGALVEIECVAVRTRRAPADAKAPRRQIGTFESDGEEIYYEDTGNGEAVVLCHGYGGNHAIWYQQVVDLAESFRVVTWDARGFGRSSNEKQDAGPRSSAKDLLALLDHLGIRKAHLVGQSMGGWTVLGFALAHPARVQSLVLADTIAGIYTPEISRAFDNYIAKARANRPENGLFPIGQHPAIGSVLARENPHQAFLYDQIGSVAQPAPATIPLLLRTTQYAHGDLRSLKLPVLLIVGSDDPIFPPDSIRRAAQLVPDAKVVEIPKAGHSPYFEKPQIWNRTVRAFLERH